METSPLHFILLLILATGIQLLFWSCKLLFLLI
nr:MAG TPA: hypothetical protein [Caudoviricetes sp.]